MKNAQHITPMERAGRWLGRKWRGCVRQEARAIQGLANKGVPIGLARLLSWIVKLAVLGLLLYSVFWLALALVFVAIAAWLARNSDLDDEKQPELRDGHSGIGLYDKDDQRIDMGDPDKP
ncbi:MAG: DUF3742 family protein [Nitrospiraceae bacterium]